MWKSCSPESGMKPERRRIRSEKYNRSVGKLWFVYAVLFELLYVPLLIPVLHHSGILWFGLGTPVITVGLLIGYHRVLQRYRKV